MLASELFWGSMGCLGGYFLGWCISCRRADADSKPNLNPSNPNPLALTLTPLALTTIFFTLSSIFSVVKDT